MECYHPIWLLGLRSVFTWLRTAQLDVLENTELFGWPILASQIGQLLQKSGDRVKWELLHKLQGAGKQVSFTKHSCTTVPLYGMSGKDRAVKWDINIFVLKIIYIPLCFIS